VSWSEMLTISNEIEMDRSNDDIKYSRVECWRDCLRWRCSAVHCIALHCIGVE
jgi:hypothetical protein